MFEYFFHMSVLKFIVEYIIASGVVCYLGCFAYEENP
jgi:hypothetical protein